MREVEFRGFAVDEKKWFYGSYLKLDKVTLCPIGITEDDINNNQQHYIIFQGFSDWNMPKQNYRVDIVPESVGQYTGFQDKHGKKIYEGDIVNNPECAVLDGTVQYLSEVVFHKGKWMLKEKLKSGEYVIDCNLYSEVRILEVVGNRFDNPELIKEE